MPSGPSWRAAANPAEDIKMTYGLDCRAMRFTEDDGFSPQDVSVLNAAWDDLEGPAIEAIDEGAAADLKRELERTWFEGWRDDDLLLFTRTIFRAKAIERSAPENILKPTGFSVLYAVLKLTRSPMPEPATDGHKGPGRRPTFPAYEAIAKTAGCGIQTVGVKLAVLTEIGLINIGKDRRIVINDQALTAEIDLVLPFM